jgi:hypothetical protein
MNPKTFIKDDFLCNFGGVKSSKYYNPHLMKKIYFLLILSVSVSLTSSAQLVYKDVAGIFYARCTSCHHVNGGAPFSMMNYSEAYPHASAIQSDLNIGKMPPWPPDTNYTRLLHERIITQTEKSAILNWISTGALQGDTTLAPPAPVYTKYHLYGTPDLILQIPGFASNATTADVYNCFALPTGLAGDRIIRGFEIVPNNLGIVHHVVVNIDTTGTVLSDLSGGCFSEPGQLGIGGWAPGSPPTVYPGSATLKMGMRLKAGSKLILQMHYPAGSGGQIDSTQIRLYFYPQGTTGIRNVYANTFLQNWVMPINANTTPTFTAKYPSGSTTLPVSMSIFATSPHSHHLCIDMLVYAYRTSPADTIPLIHIPKWDFNWQGLYVHPHLVKVPLGYKLFSRHKFDNTTNNPDNPSNPPVNVSAGTSTTNEMLFDSFEWMYYQTGDENIDIGNLLSGDSLLSSVSEPPVSSETINSYVFPNPVNESATIIVVNERVANCEIKFFDIYGKKIVVDVRRNTDSFTIRKANLPSGVYFYTLSSGKFTGSGKIILMPH